MLRCLLETSCFRDVSSETPRQASGRERAHTSWAATLDIELAHNPPHMPAHNHRSSHMAAHNIPQYTIVYHSVPQHTIVYHSIPQFTIVQHSIAQYSIVLDFCVSGLAWSSPVYKESLYYTRKPLTLEGIPLLQKDIFYYRRKSFIIEGNPLFQKDIPYCERNPLL